MSVDLNDVQSHVLRNINPAEAVYVFFRITDLRRFRDFLGRALSGGAAQSEVAPRVYSEAHRSERGAPSVSMNIGFTPSGLAALGIDRCTLSTFPEPFKEGMAARAARLGDTGPSAPENWDGCLGSRQVHGVVWWNFRANRGEMQRDPERDAEREAALVREAEEIAARSGAEPLHIETGRANYRKVDHSYQSFEHFGFRDGVSQPWVDLGAAPPQPGGGTPRDGDAWAPVAPGEFILGYRDEDGRVQPWPANQRLRQSGTYMVFRKLEQDVVGFRRFLRQAARDAQEARLLAAQMMGRHYDGTPLVHAAAPAVGAAHRSRDVNDFRYGRDDPEGRQCPIGAHIRRANPRDSGDRDDARRHRIIRRGIAYGRPLPEGSAGDGARRGLLFVAINARIDQQFEFVQSRWMNSGELGGQVGAGRDPITGAHGGTVADCFVSPSRPAPLTRLTRFVTTRGGDYFFVPGLAALKAMAEGDDFAPQDDAHVIGRALGLAQTPDPIDLDGLVRKGIAAVRSNPPRDGFTVELPHAPKRLVAVAGHAEVASALKQSGVFAQPYAERIARMLGGRQMLVSLPDGDPLRNTRLDILNRGFDALVGGHAGPPHAWIADLVRSIAEEALLRVRPRGWLDVVTELGSLVPIILAEQLFGVPGPNWVSPTAIAALYGRTEVTDIPASWLGALPPVRQADMPTLTMQAWTCLTFIHVFVNLVNAAEGARLGERAAFELLSHIGDLIERARLGSAPRNTLLSNLVAGNPADFGITASQYDEHVRLILMEITVSSVGTICKALTNWVDVALDNPDLMRLVRTAVHEQLTHPELHDEKDAEIEGLILEGLRFAPVSSALFRVATKRATIGGQPVRRGTSVALLLEAAMQDQRAFRNPNDIVATRQRNLYLHFADTSPHVCYAGRLALVELREIVKALIGLKNLRRAAGPRGVKAEQFRLPQSLVVRFDPA